MTRLLLVLSSFFVLLATSLSTMASAQAAEVEIVSEALSTFLTDIRRRPNLLSGSSPVSVSLGINALNMDVDVYGVVTAHVWLNMAWDDARLAWDPAGFNNASKMALPSDAIWVPDVVLYNSHMSGNRLASDKSVVVFSDGSVTLFDDQLLRFRCDDYFNRSRSNHLWAPFECSAKFGSWAFNGNEVDLSSVAAAVETSDLSGSGSLKILSSSINRNEVFYSCCPEPYVDVTVNFVLQRAYVISEEGAIKWNPLEESV